MTDDPSWQLRLVTQGGVLFSLGLVAGLIYTFVLIGRVEAWPLVPALDFTFPGTEDAWRRTHLGLLFNAIALLLFALAMHVIRLGRRQRTAYAVSVLVTAWGNSAGFVIGAVFGERGLAMGGSAPNTIVYLCFLVAVVTAFVQAGLLVLGARKARQALTT